MTAILNQRDLASWKDLIAEAIHEPDAMLSNLKVTRAHYLLSLALREVVGEEAGANFHSWAVWGSRKAGVTIREEGLERALREVTILATGTGLLSSWLLGEGLRSWLPRGSVPILSVAGAVSAGWMGRRWLLAGRRRAAELMRQGNRTVLEDIGSATGRFVTWFATVKDGDAAAFDRFLKGFRPGKTEAGGQDLLRRAFTHYYRAAQTRDVQQKQQQCYFANCLAILHEYIRLQRYISGALPWIVRRCVTFRLMRYEVGPLRMAVRDDVPSLAGLEYPESLREFSDPELIAFLFGPHGLDRGGNRLPGTRTRDWTRLDQRMKYIVNLFRALHLHPDVIAAPYSPRQFEQIRDGQMPQGPL
ncbi:MAG: hypothetical protein ACRELG_00020 [Gemmataceae bacterium]